MDTNPKHINFKKLLEYFVAHLEYCNFQLEKNNSNSDFISARELFYKTNKYKNFEKIFRSPDFKKTGNIVTSNFISKGHIVSFDNINLEIVPNTTAHGTDTPPEKHNYKSNGNIIRYGFCNIRPESWNGESIATLEAVEVGYGTKFKQRITAPISIQELGLFDEQEPNGTLVNFYTTYFDYIKKEDNMNISTSNSNNNFVEEVKNLLLQTKNLILTGAPGTGKTYLAKQIADELTGWDKNAKNNIGKTNPCVTMVQFHPSYDYTDFVEGLRPIDNGNGEIGFERKDGTFKEFCKRATKNFEDSKKTTEVLIKERNIEDLFLDFQDHIAQEIDSNEKFEIEGIRSNLKIPITEIVPTERYTINTATRNQQTINLTPMLDNYYAYKEYIESNNEPVTTKVAKEIFKVTSATYTYGFVKAFYEFVQKHNKNNTSYDTQKEVKKIETAGTFKLKNYVFIIDEINRGEISKIFGELFYAIDPGYRGKVGRINTQYQNLLKDGNRFLDGFYVPENVYIIGTMNDIDRSVDSFDFAMRRRFAWKEITPTDTQDSMLSTLKLKEAKNRMNSLNKAISEIHELGTQYQLGASYFMKIEEYEYDYDKLWNFHIKGLLYEYLRGVPGADSKLADLKKAYEPENEQ